MRNDVLNGAKKLSSQLYKMLAPVYYRVYLYISFMMWTVHYYLHLGQYADLGHVAMNLVLLVCAYGSAQFLVACYGYSRYYPSAVFTSKVNEPVQMYGFLQTYLRDYMLGSTPTYNGFCHYCDILRPPRSHHCLVCCACVFRFEFHSNIVGTCIGLLNYKHFLGFLITNIIYVFLITEGMIQAIMNDDIDLGYKKVFGILVLSGFFNLVYCVPKLFLMVLNMVRNESMIERNAINEYLMTGNNRHPIITEGRLLDECWLSRLESFWRSVGYDANVSVLENRPSKFRRFFGKFISKKNMMAEKNLESRENTISIADRLGVDIKCRNDNSLEISNRCEKGAQSFVNSKISKDKRNGRDKDKSTVPDILRENDLLSNEFLNNPRLMWFSSIEGIRDRSKLNPYNLGWLENCKQLLGDSFWQWFTIDVTCKGTGMEYPKNSSELVDDLEAFL